MNISLRLSKFSRQRPAPSTTHSSGASTRCTGRSVSWRRPAVEATQHAAAADEVDAVEDQVLRELGRGLRQARDHRVADRADLLLDRAAHLLGHEQDRLRQARHEVAAAHLGLELVVDRAGRADRELDLLGGALADGDAVLPPHVRLDRGVDVERPDAHRFERDDAAERDHRDLGGAAADVDDHVAHRLVDRQPGADRGRHRLLDQVGLRGAGPARGFEHRALLDVRDRRRHADEHARAIQPVDAGPLEQQPDHALRDLEVGDRAAAQRPHRDDVAGRAADHLPRLLPHREHVLRAAVERDDGRLVQDDPAPARVDERVRGTEIDREVARQDVPPLTRPAAVRGDRYSGARARSPRSNSAMLCSIVDRTPVAHEHDHDADRAGDDGEQEERHGS